MTVGCVPFSWTLGISRFLSLALILSERTLNSAAQVDLVLAILFPHLPTCLDSWDVTVLAFYSQLVVKASVTLFVSIMSNIILLRAWEIRITQHSPSRLASTYIRLESQKTSEELQYQSQRQI